MALLDTLSYTQLEAKCEAICLKAHIGDRIEYVFRLQTTSPRICWKGSVVEASPKSLLINWNGRQCGKGMKRGGTLKFPLKKMIDKIHHVVAISLFPLGEPALSTGLPEEVVNTDEAPVSDEEDIVFDDDTNMRDADMMLDAPDANDVLAFDDHDDYADVPTQNVPTQNADTHSRQGRNDEASLIANVRNPVRRQRLAADEAREKLRDYHDRRQRLFVDVDAPVRRVVEKRDRDTELFGMEHFERMLTAVTTTIASSFARINPPHDPYALVSALEEAKSGATWTKVCPGLRVTDVVTIPREDHLFCPILFLGRPDEIEEGLKDLRTLWSVSPRTTEQADELRLQQATVMELFSCTFPRNTKGDYEVILKQYARLIALLISASSWMGPAVSTKFAASFRSAWEGGKVDFVQLIRAATSTSTSAVLKTTVLQTTNASLADNAQRGGGRHKTKKGIFRGGARTPAPPWKTNTAIQQPQQPVFAAQPQPTYAAQQVGQKWFPPGYHQ